MPGGAIRVQIRGGKQLQRKLNRLASVTQRKIMRPAVSAGLVPFNKSAKRRAARSSGLLSKSIGTRVKVYRRSGVVYGVVGPRTRFSAMVGGVTARREIPTKYAHLVEFGTSAHIIRPKNRKALAFDGTVVKVVRHRGTAARPFLRPAFDHNKRKAIGIVTARAWTGIRKEAMRR